MTTDISPSAPAKHPHTKADYRRHKTALNEIHADSEIIEQALFRVGRNLKTFRGRRLCFCGGDSTFEAFCQTELGNSRQEVYRLIQANDVLQNLLVCGIPKQDL